MKQKYFYDEDMIQGECLHICMQSSGKFHTWLRVKNAMSVNIRHIKYEKMNKGKKKKVFLVVVGVTLWIFRRKEFCTSAHVEWWNILGIECFL